MSFPKVWKPALQPASMILLLPMASCLSIKARYLTRFYKVLDSLTSCYLSDLISSYNPTQSAPATLTHVPGILFLWSLMTSPILQMSLSQQQGLSLAPHLNVSTSPPRSLFYLFSREHFYSVIFYIIQYYTYIFLYCSYLIKNKL